MFPSISNAVLSLLRASKKPKSAVRLEKDLRKAVRAEGPSDESLWYDQENPNITRLSHGADVADGVFFCCCGADNTLIHYRGDHPFKHLTCRSCNRVYSTECATSDILQVGVIKPTHQPTRELRIGQLCPECGLTHRAVMKHGKVSFGLTCVCGKVADNSWTRFYIGSNMDYRRDPVSFPTELKLRHKMKLVEEHNRAKQKTRLEEPKRAHIHFQEQEYVGKPRRVEESLEVPPTASLNRPKIVHRGRKRCGGEMRRPQMHEHPLRGYDV